MDIEDIVLIAGISFFIVTAGLVIWRMAQWGFVQGFLSSRKIKWAMVTALIFISLVITFLLINLRTISADSWVSLSLTVGLVGITAVYAFCTAMQADASLKMAEEMREQRIIVSRPYIIQTARYKSVEGSYFPDFDYFEIHNAGNAPAIKVIISAFDEERKCRKSITIGFLGMGESHELRLMEFSEFIGKTCYLVSEYKSIHSHGSQTWYQTWLTFEIQHDSDTGKPSLREGGWEFCDNVSEKDLVNVVAYSKELFQR